MDQDTEGDLELKLSMETPADSLPLGLQRPGLTPHLDAVAVSTEQPMDPGPACTAAKGNRRGEEGDRERAGDLPREGERRLACGVAVPSVFEQTVGGERIGFATVLMTAGTIEGIGDGHVGRGGAEKIRPGSGNFVDMSNAGVIAPGDGEFPREDAAGRARKVSQHAGVAKDILGERSGTVSLMLPADEKRRTGVDICIGSGLGDSRFELACLKLLIQSALLRATC